ncbi:MAG: hypothetical protein QXU60_00595 [Sulfolobales archaeon]
MWLSGDTVFISSHDLREVLRNNKKIISLETFSEFRDLIEQVYLVMVLESHQNLNYATCKWRVLINDFNISRVLRPYSEFLYKEKRYMILAYDLTPIKHMLSDVNRISIEYQGDQIIKVHIASLISTYSIASKIRNVNKSESVYLDLESKILETGAYTLVSFPRDLAYDVDVSLYIIPLTEASEISIDNKNIILKDLEEISMRITPDKKSIPLAVASGAVLIPIKVMQEKGYKEPNYVINDTHIEKIDPDKIRVRILIDNLGDIDSKEILAVAINKGRNIAVAKAKGDEREFTLELSKNIIDRGDPYITIRVIWKWGDKKYFTSRNIAL